MIEKSLNKLNTLGWCTYLKLRHLKIRQKYINFQNSLPYSAVDKPSLNKFYLIIAEFNGPLYAAL